MSERLHIVRKGEWLTIIAHEHGFPKAELLYEDKLNEPLKKKRPDPNALYAGDEVWIPPSPYQAELAQKKAGRLSYKITAKLPAKEKLEVRLFDEQKQPLANQPYQLKIGAWVKDGTTDGKGWVKEEFDASLLRFGSYTLLIAGKAIALGVGVLDPLDTPEGIQARLKNLGYDVGPVDGVLNKKTRLAICRFQKDQSLTIDGVAGPKTRAKLDEEYHKTD